ncbi:zinc finger protein-like protein [Amylocarpus encephaloides]|uniref:polynucleotide adenylyltransferase n=1 Tax=Amylocarpus encephaloides TaxID=45428 RepID=A0A9P7YQM0_9HELO|nr:zinc finger protein-like protein [Amylocarpus encephaloides]
MEGLPSSASSHHQYQSAQWSRLVRRNTLENSALPSTPATAASSQHPSQLDLLPILLPQQPVFHQAQLAQYNRLVSSGRAPRLQTSPLPPLLSAQHIQAVSGPRSGSTSGNTARTTKSAVRGGHGNKESRKSSKGERALIAEKEKLVTMPGKKLDKSNQLPPRPHIHHQNTSLSQQSSSVPSTPHQHARKFSFESREPSPHATNNHSPRSAYSESNIVLPSRAPPPRGGCRYETAQAHSKRRMPYSIGSERLERQSASTVRSKLTEDEERSLTTDMRELYDRLLPTPESEDRRKQLIEKLEKLFNAEWPGHDIKVHVFGSSGNLLCTDESDVDICITTDAKEMEGVCLIADLLARNGMERVICVSTAKVPIVKIWDPELRLACDMNVNNTLALENTRMIKTYVQIDDRVRPLAMIIKHWTKRRIVNDAAFGGTLSSYTWICLIIYFLQNRSPPLLPALHQRPHMKLPPKNGLESAFADDLTVLEGFGKKNTESLGDLLFFFFRFYGHEFDYDKHVVSVRNGKSISKVEKKWHLANNNTLCVEEPFNVGRNLGNTADDTSFRGLHLEIRRAFDLVSQAELDTCCEQFQYPKEEERVWERPPSKPRPVLRSTSQSNRGGRGGNRGGGRHNNQHNRSGNSNRRASSAGFDNQQSGSYTPGVLPPNMTAQDIWLQQQAQSRLHNDLYATYSVLQAQENSLRLQLYHQSQGYLQAPHNQAFTQSQQSASSSGSVKQQATDRNRTSSHEQPPLTAPIRPEMYYYSLGYPNSPMFGYQTSSTNPSSPSLSPAVPELRRSVHRSSVTNGAGQSLQSSSTLRSHSQPAVRSASAQMTMQRSGVPNLGLGIYQSSRQALPIPNFIADENSADHMVEPNSVAPATTPPEHNTPKEYVGYYVNTTRALPSRRESALSIPAFGDLGHNGRRRLSTDQLPPSILDRLRRPSRSPSPLGHDRSFSTGAPLAPLSATHLHHGVSSSNLRTLNTQTPAVVNGSSLPTPVSIPNWQASINGALMGDDRTSDIAGSLDSASQASGTPSEIHEMEEDLSGQLTPREARFGDRVDAPLVVNGSTPHTAAFAILNGTPPTDTIPSLANGTVISSEQSGIPARLSPNSRNRLARQNGGMSPLDIGAGYHDTVREDLPHLSPVYETQTPSPTASRKFESVIDRNGMRMPLKPVDDNEELGKPSTKTGLINSHQSKQHSVSQKANGHTRASKSEGGGASGSWQKISKGKKKGISSDTKNTTIGQPQSEKLPNKESERKGG